MTAVVISSDLERNLERDNDANWADFALTQFSREDEFVTISVGGVIRSERGSSWGGWTTSLRWPIDAAQAQVGDIVRVWSSGTSVKGISLWRGETLVPILYETKVEREEAHRLWVEDYHKRQQEEFQRDEAKLDREFEKLPLPLRRRIERFRDESPDFRWSEEAYEMAACAEAGRLVKWANDPKVAKKLHDNKIKIVRPEFLNLSSYEWEPEQGTDEWEDTPLNVLTAIDAINSKLNGYNYTLLENLFPDMDRGHSGNTWGAAVSFARIIIEKGDEAPL